MGKRRYRRKVTKFDQMVGTMILGGIILYAIYKKIVQVLNDFFNHLVNQAQQLSVINWILIAIIIFSSIFLIVMFIQRNQRRNSRYLQEQAIYRVLRDAEYEKLMNMTSRDFERFVADLFISQGYEAELTPPTGDGGKDVILKKNGAVSIVECKRYSQHNKVSVTAIQKFHSAVIDCKAKEGFFVTTSFFTQPAMNYCRDKPIKLVDLPRLMEMIHDAKARK